MQTFISPADFRSRIPLARDLTYRLLKEGRIRSMRLGHKFYIPVEELERFLDAEVKAVKTKPTKIS